MAYNLGQLSTDDHLIGLGVYTPAQQQAVRACFEGLGEGVDRFGLTHGDLVPGNVVVGGDGVPRLIDWGCASVGPAPYQDYLRIWSDEAFSPNDLEAFAEGYGVAFARMRETMIDIHLLSSLDLVRWALDRRPDRLEEVTGKAAIAVEQWFSLHHV